MTRTGSALLVALAAAAEGCLGGSVSSCEGVVCPPIQHVPVRGGSYAGSFTLPEGEAVVPFPRDPQPYGLVIDRDAGVATFTATRDGSVVVERWRIR